MNKGRVGAIGCKTEEQRRCSDLMLINGVCCLWLSCQQITPCAKINHISCVGLQGRVAWLHWQRLELKYLPSKRVARAGAVVWQLALLGSAQRGRSWRGTKEKSLKKTFVLSLSPFPKDSMFFLRRKMLLSQISNMRLPAFSFCY